MTEKGKDRVKAALFLVCVVGFIVSLFLTVGCSATIETAGKHNAGVDIARVNADAEKARSDAQVAMMKALVEALSRLGVPAPAKQVGPLCLASDNVTPVPCEAIR